MTQDMVTPSFLSDFLVYPERRALAFVHISANDMIVILRQNTSFCRCGIMMLPHLVNRHETQHPYRYLPYGDAHIPSGRGRAACHTAGWPGGLRACGSPIRVQHESRRAASPARTAPTHRAPPAGRHVTVTLTWAGSPAERRPIAARGAQRSSTQEAAAAQPTLWSMPGLHRTPAPTRRAESPFCRVQPTLPW